MKDKIDETIKCSMKKKTEIFSSCHHGKKSSSHPLYCYDIKIYLTIFSFSKSLFYLASKKKSLSNNLVL